MKRICKKSCLPLCLLFSIQVVTPVWGQTTENRETPQPVTESPQETSKNTTSPTYTPTHQEADTQTSATESVSETIPKLPLPASSQDRNSAQTDASASDNPAATSDTTQQRASFVHQDVAPAFPLQGAPQQLEADAKRKTSVLDQPPPSLQQDTDAKAGPASPSDITTHPPSSSPSDSATLVPDQNSKAERGKNLGVIPISTPPTPTKLAPHQNADNVAVKSETVEIPREINSADPAKINFSLPPQDLRPPSVSYSVLFEDINKAKIFSDAKTVADLIPDQSPSSLVALYLSERDKKDFILKSFVSRHFALPLRAEITYKRKPNENVRDYISGMWDVLNRPADIPVAYSSLLPLPYPYIVPGGRFSELNYWDTYFSMIGLYEDQKIDIMRDMIRDMASLIDRYGHIPNAARTYYLGRSQPPFFALMLDLLAMQDGQVVYTAFLPELQAEHDYWMNGADALKTDEAYRRAVRINNNTVLNRYWDDLDLPRDESYPEDIATAAHSSRNPNIVYRDLRAGSESGWDFTARWLADGHTLSTIHTTDILPIDLNCLMAHMEQTLAHAYALKNNTILAKQYNDIANNRIATIRKVFWNDQEKAFYDYDWKNKQPTSVLSAATAVPLFLQMAGEEQAAGVASILEKRLLKAGGLVQTEIASGQQWDAPNGWAPSEWMAIKGLNAYGYEDLARTIATKWMARVIGTYEKSGVLMEKYDVVSTSISPVGGKGGGEYPNQIGFGWTNGTLLGLMNRYPQVLRLILDKNPAADQPSREPEALPPFNSYDVRSSDVSVQKYATPPTYLQKMIENENKKN
ncbi:alpha,alpha-trehalase TreF [Acetobacter sp. DmW_136]|uniref:alpha,alpha-trehalase TreF n=1 Tax=Acetobacter sp. DmW_136 TaxID=2591091 RepID=UPI00123BBF75|nr:alpha,alpha-trehalase TreF [Acetobacter sp. DmW_136]KAA8385952.1 alpha,alpha-trehalase TreF [Acetobacter sp. DmW_136]